MHKLSMKDIWGKESMILYMVLLIFVSFIGPFQNDYSHQAAAAKREKMTEPVVVMETTKGTIKIKIYKNEVPITVIFWI